MTKPQETDSNVVTDEHDQVDDIREPDQADNTELPDNPELLTAAAKALQEENAKLRRQSRQAQRDVKRLQNEVQEKAANAQVFSTLAEERATRLKLLEGNGSSGKTRETRTATPGNLAEALSGLELADYLDDTDKDGKPLKPGVVRLVSDLADRGVILTPDRVQAMIDERASQERNSITEQQNQINEVTSQYNSTVAQQLRDPNSELRRESEREFEDYLKRHPKADQTAAMEISIVRAATNLGISLAKETSGNGNRGSERRTGGGGAPRNRGIGGGEFNAQVTEADVDRFARYGSSEIPPEQLKKMAKASKERTTVWDREAARANR